MTIRLRLTLLFVALLCGLGLARTAIVVGGLSKTLTDIVVTDAGNKAQEVQDYLNDLNDEVREANPHAILNLSASEALPRAFSDDGSFIQVTALDGGVLNKSDNLGSLALPVPERAGTREIDLPVPHLESSRVVVFARALRLPRQGRIGWIQVAHSLQNQQRALQQLVIFEAVALTATTLAAFALGYVFAGRALRPVAAITEQVRGWTRDDLHRRLPIQDPVYDEIGRLAQTFNDLFNRLEAAFAAQQRFVSDASHELRSPLTAIRGHLQLVQRRGETHPEDARKWIATAIREVDRLTRLVNAMLELARGEVGATSRAHRRLDLAVVAREVVEQQGVMAARLRFEGDPDGMWVAGDDGQLRQVLINLLDNALRATRDAGEVTVRVLREGAEVVLQVADTGQGIPPEAQDRLFDRFYRVDSARDRSEGGTGLGLAITAAILTAHGGTVGVQSEIGRGSTFTVRLPSDG